MNSSFLYHGSYTHRFAKYVVDMLRSMTLKDAAARLGVSWDTIKEIHSNHLKRRYSPPSFDGVECIGIIRVKQRIFSLSTLIVTNHSLI